MTAPALNLASPLDGTVFETETVQVIGTTDADASVGINGLLVEVQSGGAFASWVLLSPGTNTITVTAADQAGNETVITRTVTYEGGTSGDKVYLPVLNK